MKRCFIFDIDGTLADCSHRVPLLPDYRAFFAACVDDTPIAPVVTLFDLLNSAEWDNAPAVICVSGRSDEVYQETRVWLARNTGMPAAIYMRKAGDHRPDNVVKLELLTQLRADGFEPIMVFDDRNSVVQMWRDAGIPCAQVAPGDF